VAPARSPPARARLLAAPTPVRMHAVHARLERMHAESACVRPVACAGVKSGGSGRSGNSSRSGRRGSRGSLPAPVAKLRDALAGMDVDARQLQLHESIGQGGFGSVFRGTWRGLNVCTDLHAVHACVGRWGAHRMLCRFRRRSCMTPLGVQVAVKTVTFQERFEAAGGTAQQRAIAEAAITFSLTHDNVIATYFHEIKPLQVRAVPHAFAPCAR
jgi:hypothetical protein